MARLHFNGKTNKTTIFFFKPFVSFLLLTKMKIDQEPKKQIKKTCSFLLYNQNINYPRKTLNNGYLGSRNDEERSEMRYVM